MSKTSGRFQNRPFMDNQPFMALARGNAPVRASQYASNAFTNVRRLSQNEVDGVDHINISPGGLTDIGYALDFKAQYKFTHNVFGYFATIQGFYNWLRSNSRDDAYRTVVSRALDNHARNNRDDLNAYVVNFRFLIVDAIWQKIKSYPTMLTAFRESELPFEMYYDQFLDRTDKEAGTTRSRPSIAQWIIPALQVMREAAKENTEPDLSYLIADKEELEEFYDSWRKQMADNEAAKEAAKAASFRARKAVKQAAFNNQQKQADEEVAQQPDVETQTPEAEVAAGTTEETVVTAVATEEPAVAETAQS